MSEQGFGNGAGSIDEFMESILGSDPADHQSSAIGAGYPQIRTSSANIGAFGSLSPSGAGGSDNNGRRGRNNALSIPNDGLNPAALKGMTDIDIAMRADLGRQRKTKQAAALKKGKARNTKKMNICKDIIMMWMKMKGLLLCHFSMTHPSPTSIYPMFEIAYNYDPLDIPSIVAAITDEESGAKRILLHAFRHKTFLLGVDVAEKITLAHFICRVVYSAVADTAAQRAATFKMSKEPPPLRRVIIVKPDVLNAPAVVPAPNALNGGGGARQRPRKQNGHLPGPGAPDNDIDGGGENGGGAEDELAQVQRRIEHAKKEESIIDYFVDVGSKDYIKPGYMPKILQRKDVHSPITGDLRAFMLPSTAHFNYDECIETLKSIQLEKKRHEEIMSEIGENIPASSSHEAREHHTVKGPYCESIPADSWISQDVMYTYLCNELEFKTTTRKQKHAADMAKVNPARILAVAQTKPHGRSALVYWEEHYNDPEVKAAKKRCLQAIQESDDIVADGTGEKSVVIDASDMGIQQANMTVAGPKDKISSKVPWKKFTNILFEVCTQMGEAVNSPLTPENLDDALEVVIEHCTGENAHIFADVLMRALANDAIEESTKFGTKMKVKVAVADDEWNANANNDDADDDGSDTEIVFFAQEE